MANWYIFTPAAAAETARQELTVKAKAYGLYRRSAAEYPTAFQHPTEDKAALLVERSEPISFQNVTRPGYDFEALFDEIETKGMPIDELTDDWGL